MHTQYTTLTCQGTHIKLIMIIITIVFYVLCCWEKTILSPSVKGNCNQSKINY